jgi:hypothetical protein
MLPDNGTFLGQAMVLTYVVRFMAKRVANRATWYADVQQSVLAALTLPPIRLNCQFHLRPVVRILVILDIYASSHSPFAAGHHAT